MSLYKKRFKRRYPKGGRFRMMYSINKSSAIGLNVGEIQSTARCSKRKTDWEDLADDCYALAKETGLTRERSRELTIIARKILNGSNG